MTSDSDSQDAGAAAFSGSSDPATDVGQYVLAPPKPLKLNEFLEFVKKVNFQHVDSRRRFAHEALERGYERLRNSRGDTNESSGPTPGVTCLSNTSDEDFQTLVKNTFKNMLSNNYVYTPPAQYMEKTVVSEKAVIPEAGASVSKELPKSTDDNDTQSETMSPADNRAAIPTQSGPRLETPNRYENALYDFVERINEAPTCSRNQDASEIIDTTKQAHCTESSVVHCSDRKHKTKSQMFLENILCLETDNKYYPSPGRRKTGYSLRNRSDSADLPFSILTIREQRDFLKSTGDSFVQDAPCYEISKMYGVETSGPLVGTDSWCKCRECRSAKQKESLTVFCRFYGFRKLKFVDNLLCTSGFLLPEECTDIDLRLWLPLNRCFPLNNGKEDFLDPPNHLFDGEMSKFLLRRIGNQFCAVVSQEKKALSWLETDEVVFWKRPVSGVREMCDVCETTLFNMHWVCPKCGFCVCLDCYERRMEKTIEEQEVYDSDKSNCFRWLRCAKGKHHAHSSLLPIQIIPSTCLLDLADMVHEVRALHSIKSSGCPCEKDDDNHSSPFAKDFFASRRKRADSNNLTDSSKVEGTSSRKRPADLSVTESSTTGEILEQKSKERKVSRPGSLLSKEGGRGGINLSDLIAKRIEDKVSSTPKLPRLSADPTKKGVSKLHDQISPHNWLCEGRLLQLNDSSHPKNIDIFKVHWQHGMPVLVSGVGQYLHMDLWHPSTLSREYGDESTKNSLVNCITGSIVTNMKIRDFWDGFENISQRLMDENKKTMILKLKDWPPTQAFHEVMPDMFEDLVNALPLPEYSDVDGKCNLASRLPHFFVKPDLGPKMYNAYGWVTETGWRQGTTNLHLDISDAVNIMVYVGIPADEPPEAKSRLLQIVREGEVDEVQFRRALTDRPGALWHIFHQQDTDKIRKFIRKVCDERGESLAVDHDPIHDQQMYLDRELRHRLKEEYGVEGYGILQCQGDGVFIPAGAPHQVFNLHSCVKIAEDFVSPEHVGHCFTLTNEFRYLSSTHSNHEDKLQIKNIIYHTIKDLVSSAIHVNCVGH